MAEDDGIEKDGELPDEDDDNAHQDSDEALPADAKEVVAQSRIAASTSSTRPQIFATAS
ncbi:MAG: hypothetical protein ABJB10_11720 [Mesorhizobium sp.]